MKVHQQPDWEAAHAQICLQLGFVSRQQRRNSLELQEDGVRYQHVGSEAQRYRHALVEDRDRHLAEQPDAGLFKLKPQARG